ncbi:sensor histidine kinase [Anaerosporobacter sp.]
MLQQLRKHLILLFTSLSSLILTISIIGSLFLNLKQIKSHSLDSYKTVQDTINYKLQTEQIISHGWLSQMETKYKLIIHIRENGIPFLYNGSWNPFSTNIPHDTHTDYESQRENVISSVEKLAMNDGMNLTSNFTSPTKIASPIYEIQPKHASVAYASISLISTGDTTLQLTLIQFRPQELNDKIIQSLLFVGIAIIGNIGLFFVSCYLVNKALKPAIENEKKQNTFIASASHDLRSPLTIIQTNASALLIDGVDSKKFINKIIEECTYMSRLISDMLILASSDSKTWHIQRQLIETEPYLIDLFDSFYEACKKREHYLDLDLPDEELPPIEVDKTRLTQVIGILIDNVLSYSPIDSTIILRPYVNKHWFYLYIIDHGIGIPDEHKASIFDRFYRADPSRNDTSHFGLGLSVAKELMTLHNGYIQVENTPGGGSTFILKLPLAES